jgi:four helix bundle protein
MAGWKSVEEIDAYTLGVELRDEITRLTERGRAARDFGYRDQIRDSSSSVTKNLAEGFDRYDHGQFAYHANVAKGSLGETIDALKDGKAKRYITDEEFGRLFALAERARKATGGLIRYLHSSQAPGEKARRRPPRKRN